MNKYLKCIKSCEHKNSRNSRKFDRDFIEKIASTNCREQAYQKKVASTNATKAKVVCPSIRGSNHFSSNISIQNCYMYDNGRR